ncbi:hypothetical protein [Polaromonas sp. DSR2-3-2]|uniref:hypothetical protein n=1 Tax=unclassified Polaromonas TaxID=2638319 RepID=UPI003CF15D70
MMMHSPGTHRGDAAALEQLKQLWRQVGASRGTPAPHPEQLADFIHRLGTPERDQLESVLALAARGRELPGDLSVVSWAAAYTRPALLAQLAAHGLAFTGAHLFACGLGLKNQGRPKWASTASLAGTASSPESRSGGRRMIGSSWVG